MLLTRLGTQLFSVFQQLLTLYGKNEKANDMGAKIKSFIGTLNTYTDPDKDMSGWDKETLGEEGVLVGVNDPIGLPSSSAG